MQCRFELAAVIRYRFCKLGWTFHDVESQLPGLVPSDAVAKNTVSLAMARGRISFGPDLFRFVDHASQGVASGTSISHRRFRICVHRHNCIFRHQANVR